MRVFLLAGRAGCGKDLFGKYLKRKLDARGHNCCILHFTTPLYEYAKNYFSWNDSNEEKPREFLQEMGIEVIQKKLGKKNFLIDRLCEDIDILKNFFDIFIITDGRLINEFVEIRKRFLDTTIIHIIRNDYDNGLTDIENSHITENEMSLFDYYDYTVYNDSLDDFYKYADKIIDDFEGEEII